MSSMPEASWHDIPSPSHLGFIPAGSHISSPECILKMSYPVQGSAWRRFLLFPLGQCPGETGLYRHYCHLLLWAHRSSRPAEPLWPARASPCLLSWRAQLKEDSGFSPAQPHSSASLLQSWGAPTPFPTGRLSMLLFDFLF